MADYWKSQGRKFCDFCKCWIADNKPSIEFHEGGKKHKENVTKRIKEIHKNSAKQAKITKKFENDLQNMERAAMAAYLKDVEGDTVDLTAQEIIRNKHNRKIEEPSKVENPNQMPEASAATNPRHKLSKDLPADVDFCDPTTFHRARVPRYPKNPNVVSGSSSSGGGGSGAGENKPQGKGKSNREKRKGKKSQEDDGLKKKNFHKVWYEARSPEGYTYYWHIETNETSWEPPEEDFMTIAEQEEEAKEQALQAELLQQMEEEEAKDKADIFEEQRANAEREKYKALRRLQKTTGNTDNEVEVKEEKEDIPYRRDYSVPDRVDPYGPWQTVEIKPKKVIDLQLPKKKVVQVIKPVVKEAPVPQRTFVEKKITRISTGDSDEDEAPTTFKKRKFGNKSVRKRLDDD
ncbi:WW domain-binding protein 4 [Microplitis demolitor]|uniref:WW domain-binding protein 4 n=1 Tax=Microplitis demolitor TaxID=69319 RepID=UPI0004CD7A27|nr:WW domain-binding protein 4 [Microplitis demolitor]